jgi:hypothetical protein
MRHTNKTVEQKRSSSYKSATVDGINGLKGLVSAQNKRPEHIGTFVGAFARVFLHSL